MKFSDIKFERSLRQGKPRLTNSHSRSVMTSKRMQTLLDDGFGYGRDEAYTPWIRITKGLSSKASNLVVARTPIHKRSLHLLSLLEKTAAHAAVWLGAREIREQFPLYPWPAEHPMSGYDNLRDIRMGKAPALTDIAREADIEIGHNPGSDIPYVATTDLVVRVGDFPEDRLVFISCKPRGAMLDPKRGERTRERLELERRYAKAIGAHHVIFTGEEVCPRLKANLDWLMPHYVQMQDVAWARRRITFVEAFMATDSRQAVSDRIQQSAIACATSTKDAQEHFRAAAWFGAIDVDLTQPLLMSKPLIPDVKQRKAALRSALLGGTRCA